MKYFRPHIRKNCDDLLGDQRPFPKHQGLNDLRHEEGLCRRLHRHRQPQPQEDPHLRAARRQRWVLHIQGFLAPGKLRNG